MIDWYQNTENGGRLRSKCFLLLEVRKCQAQETDGKDIGHFQIIHSLKKHHILFSSTESKSYAEK